MDNYFSEISDRNLLFVVVFNRSSVALLLVGEKTVVHVISS